MKGKFNLKDYFSFTGNEKVRAKVKGLVLNGEELEVGKEYILKSGDILSVMDFEKELKNMYNKGYDEGIESCRLDLIEAMKIAIDAGETERMTLPEVVELLEPINEIYRD